MSNLFYVIGASGVGKDSLMNYARSKIDGSQPVLFAHRYITRQPFSGSENHIYLTDHEFELRKNAGLFAMDWESHEKKYGIGAEINQWLKLAFNVVVNGSRQYLPVAQQIYPDLITVLIDADMDIVYSRLASRARESDEEIAKRIARNAEITADLKNCIKIHNNDLLEKAGDELVEIISSKTKLFV